jgi:PAS domain S-box-containing protein
MPPAGTSGAETEQSVSAAGNDDGDLRVLILTPSGRDDRLAQQALARGGLLPCVCRDLGGLREALAAGAGVVLIAEEALPRDATDPVTWLGAEPPWSCVPLVVLTGRTSTPRSFAALRRLEGRPNVSFLERPVSKRTLVSMLRIALENRRRQYQVRDFLHEQSRLQQALRESERRAISLLDSIADGFMALDREWRITFVNPRGEEILRPLGKSRASMLGKVFWDEFPEMVGSPFDQAYRLGSRKRATGSTEIFYPRLDRWFDVRAVASADGVSIHFLDITERKQAEKHRELLIHELNHRVKNTLMIIQAMAQQTFKGTEVPAEATTKFQRRLAALGAAHNMLTQSNWEHALLEELTGATVAASGARGGQVRLAGPRVVLDPKQAVTYAMAMHELCTNAIKYGALSSEEGRVDVHWDLAEDCERNFRLTWQERGGPPVASPASLGFGSRLIKHALAQEFNGEVSMDFRPEGLTCTIEGVLLRAGAEPQ